MELSRLDVFMRVLERELYRRYQLCDGLVTPDSILLAVTNAVADARKKAEETP